MFRQSRYLIGFLFVFLSVGLVNAQQGPEHSDPYWQAAYWNNISLSGAPAREEMVAQIDFDWGYGSPHHSVATEGFSARWTRYIDVAAGTYRFTATADDGIRVYVDGDPVIDEWNDQPARTFFGDVTLSAGHHRVLVEYYENTGYAVAKVSWEPVTAPTHRWRGQYFSNRWLSGPPALVRNDAKIDFNWGYGSPAPGIPRDGFSVRWTGTIGLDAGLYRFTTTTDDGVRLWVNGHLLIDQWRDQALTSHSGTIHAAGDVPIEMEYSENGGVAAAHLTWARVGQDPPPPLPDTVIVDDTDPGFVKGGAASAWHTAEEGHGNHLTWTRNNDQMRSGYNWGRWYPDLTAGRYEVWVYVPERYSTTSQARYWIAHRDGYTLRVVDQSAHGGRWVSLGTYWFRGTQDDYVSLADVTYEPYLTRLVAWDAIQWVRR